MRSLDHYTQRLRREAQRLLPYSLRTLPNGDHGTARAILSAGEIESVSPAHTISRRLPANHPNDADWEFTSRLTFGSPETFVATIPNGRTLDHAVLSASGTLLSDLSIEPGVLPDNAAEHSALRRRTLPALEYLRGELTSLVAYGGTNNYFHWMFEVLPRVGILEKMGRKSNDGTRLLVNSSALPFQRQTLLKLGIMNVLDASRHPYVRADWLVVPSLPGIMGDPTAASVEFLQKRFGAASSGSSQKLYISRARASYRRLLNEAAVTELLKSKGFTIVTLETLSVAEQVALFASASVVVAPHGAGLTNLAFCKPATRVIELFSPSYVNGCYWALSNLVEADYRYVLGSGQRPSSDATHAGAADDYNISLPELERALQ